MRLKVFVFVHDQDIILAYEKSHKLSKLFKDYTYVFLGNRVTALVENLPNVIIARNLKYNIEQYPKLVSFTGWYALEKNGFLKDMKSNDKIAMLEYDTFLHPKFMDILSNTVKKSELYSFIPVHKDYMFYEYMDKFFEVCQHNKEEFKELRDKFILDKGKEEWMGSSNTIWTQKRLSEFINWFDINFNRIYNTEGIGHVVERAITVFAVLANEKYKFISGALKHEYLDSHETQAIHNNGIQKDYRNSIGALATL